MDRYVHRPTEVLAVRWEGNLGDLRDLIRRDEEAAVDRTGRTLWITQTVEGRVEVFPVVIGHWLVRVGGVLTGMSPAQFAATYDIVAA